MEEIKESIFEIKECCNLMLEALKKLRESGIINDIEYAQHAKTKIDFLEMYNSVLSTPIHY